MNRAFSLLLSASLFSTSLLAQSYPIHIKDPVQGLTRQNEVYERTKTSHKVIGPDNKPLVDRSHSSSNHALYHEEILKQAAGQKKPEKIKRYYYKAVSNINGKEEVLPYQKRYVLITRSAKGLCTFEIEKQGDITGSAAYLLHKEFNAHQAFDLQRMVLPNRAVKLNESWALNMKDIAHNWQKSTMMAVDLRQAKGSGKLVKVYEKEKHLFGILQFHLEMPLIALGEGKEQAQMTTGSKMVMDVTLDACIDGQLGTGILKGSFKVNAEARVPSKKGGEGKMQLNIEGNIYRARQEVPKK